MTERQKIKGFIPVLAAVIGNFFITIIKFGAFLLSGSVVMFSEAVHSVADTSNQFLLMIGIRRSTKKPDQDFIYGYGHERFFWALISACGIFFLGAGVVIYRGIDSLSHHRPLFHGPVIYWVLGISFIVESITFALAIKEIRRHRGNWNFRDIIKNGDPSTLAVLYEDGLAIFSIIIAFASILLANLTGQYFWDSVGSIVIGILLAIVAIILIAKNREFLIGKSIPPDLQDKIVRLLESEPAIERVIDFKSTTLDIGIYRIKCEIEFNGFVLLKEIYQKQTLRQEYEEIKDDFEEFKKFCVDYADRVPRLVGRKIDEIETKIRTENQGIKYIDIEIN